MRTGRLNFFLFSFLLCLLQLNATHNRAGEITYTRIAPFTTMVGGIEVNYYKYRIMVITYTDDGKGIADRCIIPVIFGDGEQADAIRINGNQTNCCDGTGCCSGIGQPIPCGEIIINALPPLPKYTVKKNIYMVDHVFPGLGSYIIRCIDPDRNAGVYNIPNSDHQAFYIESLLVLTNFKGPNSSPILTNPPIDKACLNQCFQHNPGAYDADGDSLSYEISTSRGANGQTIPGYTYPNANTSGTYSINSVTGLLSWCTPQQAAEYNIAFIVKEWRKTTNNSYQLIGYVLRDMQVIVGYCVNENPPGIIIPQDTCVVAGAFILKNILTTDPNHGDSVTVSGSGGAFSATTPTANLTNTAGVPFANPDGKLVSTFSWQTDCNHVRKQAYYTTFKAEDNGSQVNQAVFATYAIRVIPPAVKNVTVVPSGSNMKISWDLSACSPSNNPLTAYKIYRKNNCSPYIPQPCSTAIPAESGFVYVGQTNSKTNFFTDTNNGEGLVIGENYGYLVAAVYSDGSQSFGSTLVCATLKRDVPVILNVDVLSTSSQTGSIKIAWARPLSTPGNLDTTVYKGPYTYTLKYIDPFGNISAIFSVTKNAIGLLDNSFTHGNINTTLKGHTYQIDFMSDGVLIGSSQKASSVFLESVSSDRRVDLSWSAKTPWNNYSYTIQRKNPSSNTYTTIATTTLQSHSDQDKLVNGYTYCYLITSQGAYSDPTIFRPLINHSQEICALVKDLSPPCSPTLSIEADCPTNQVKISWDDIRTSCIGSDDVVNYNLFYKATIADEYKLAASLPQNQANEFIPDGSNPMLGCYAIQAVDSSGNTSPLSPDFCIENCPEFELPNVFTPNGDNINDFFKAIVVRQIKSIDLSVYDRWGNLVYKTKDPYFKWDGLSINTKQAVSEGTLFYTCIVFEPRLKGIVKRSLKGYVQVIR